MRVNPNRFTRKSPDGGTDIEYYVLGGGHVGKALARRLRADGHPTGIVDESYDSADGPGHRGDPADVHVLKAAGVSEASAVIVATRSDRRNLLIAGLVRNRFDISNVRVLANVPERTELFAEAGHDPICATSVLADAVAGDL